MSSKPCGQHVELAANGTVRVTRCSCGIVHLTLLSSGVTVRISTDVLRATLSGLALAAEKIDEAEHAALGSTSIN